MKDKKLRAKLFNLRYESNKKIAKQREAFASVGINITGEHNQKLNNFLANCIEQGIIGNGQHN